MSTRLTPGLFSELCMSSPEVRDLDRKGVLVAVRIYRADRMCRARTLPTRCTSLSRPTWDPRSRPVCLEGLRTPWALVPARTPGEGRGTRTHLLLV